MLGPPSTTPQKESQLWAASSALARRNCLDDDSALTEANPAQPMPKFDELRRTPACRFICPRVYGTRPLSGDRGRPAPCRRRAMAGAACPALPLWPLDAAILRYVGRMPSWTPPDPTGLQRTPA